MLANGGLAGPLTSFAVSQNGFVVLSRVDTTEQQPVFSIVRSCLFRSPPHAEAVDGEDVEALSTIPGASQVEGKCAFSRLGPQEQRSWRIVKRHICGIETLLNDLRRLRALRRRVAHLVEAIYERYFFTKPYIGRPSLAGIAGFRCRYCRPD